MSDWPKHPCGRAMTMGEMTKEQQLEQAKLACKRLEADFARPEFKAAIQKVLDASIEGANHE